MFCKNCGNPVNQNAVACLSCGWDPRKANKHCNNCGVEINAEQIICIKCGASLKNQSSSDEGKSIAIIAYLTLIGFIIAIIQHRNNKTRLGAYHLRQVVGLMLTGISFSIFIWIIALPMFSMSYSRMATYATFISIISFILGIGLFICAIVSLVNAVNGKLKPTPIFGKLYERWFVNMFGSDDILNDQSISSNIYESESKSAELKNIGDTFLYFFGVIALFILIITWKVNYNVLPKFDYIIIPIIGITLLYFYSKNKTLSEIKLPLKFVFIIIGIDILFKSLSFFSTSDAQLLLMNELGSDSELSPELSNTALELSNYNRNWFFHEYLSERFKIGSFYRGIILICESVIQVVFIFICITGLISLIKYISNKFKIDSLNKLQISITHDIRNKIKWSYLSSNSINETILKISSTLLGVFVVLNLFASFMYNHTIHNAVLSEVHSSIELSKSKLQMEQDSIRNVNLQREERVKSLIQLAANISPYYISDSLIVDSVYNIVIDNINALDAATEAQVYYEGLGFKSNLNGPYSNDKSSDIYLLSLGEFKDLNSANIAFKLANSIFPSSKLYYLPKKTMLSSTD
jgi:hypothetical protein